MIKTIVNKTKKIFAKNRNRHLGQEHGQNKNFDNMDNIQKKVSNEVIELISRFKNDSEKNEKNIENNTCCPSVQVDLYNTFLEYILKNSKDEILPKNFEIERDLRITERKRKELKQLATKEGIIIQKNKTTTILNNDWKNKNGN